MRWVHEAWLCALAVLAVGCKEPAQEPAPPPRPLVIDEQRVLAVDGTTVRYNGQVLPWDEGPERWQQVLGARSRLVEDISVWDELGVYLYHQAPGTSRPTAFAVLLGRTRHSRLTKTEPAFWPRQTFSGRLVVDGAAIGKGSTIAQINREKKGPDFRRDYLDGIYSYRLEDFYVRLDYGHDDSLTSFSISPPDPEAQQESSPTDAPARPPP